MQTHAALRTSLRTVFCPAVLLALVACSSPSGSPPAGAPTPGPAPTPVVSCAAPTGGPTVHEGGDVAKDEIWTAAGSPHVVRHDVRVRGGATLVIEPCAEVQLAEGAHLSVAYPGTPNQGTLVAEGTAEHPIRFGGLEGARWASVDVHAPGTARLAHVTLKGGGGGDFEDGATLMVHGDGVDGADALVFADHVTIEGSLGTGAWLRRGAAFAPGSRDLVIRGSGSDAIPWPVEIEEHALDTLPTGSYTGNQDDQILLDPSGGQVAGSGLLDDATMHERGVPYLVGRSKADKLRIGGRPDKRLVTLTIEPGVVLRFREESGLDVQAFTSDEPSTAAIRALGTAEKPIVLTSAAKTPAPGDWRGVWFGGIPVATNRMDHVRIEYAGGWCGCILSTCSTITEHEGAVIFTAQPESAFITNTEFRHIPAHGITQGFDGVLVDFRPTNTFADVTGCAQTRPRNVDTSCPKPRPSCDQ